MLECRYKGQCRIEYDTDFDVCYPCIGDWGDTCARYEPMPDVDALLALAGELDKDAVNIISAARNAQFTGGGPTMEEAKHDAYEWRCIARIIRKALGVES